MTTTQTFDSRFSIDINAMLAHLRQTGTRDALVEELARLAGRIDAIVNEGDRCRHKLRESQVYTNIGLRPREAELATDDWERVQRVKSTVDYEARLGELKSQLTLAEVSATSPEQRAEAASAIGERMSELREVAKAFENLVRSAENYLRHYLPEDSYLAQMARGEDPFNPL